MTESAIALYLGESFATLCAFDLNLPAGKNSLFEKAVYLPQTSLKNLLLQAQAACPDHKVGSVYIVTRYMDRLKTFRLGGSVIQVVPVGFENSYSAANTQLQSLAAPALILPVEANCTELFLSSELLRLKKINPEINKVVLQLPETLFDSSQTEIIRNFFEAQKFKIFNIPHPFDFESVRKTLLNAGSEGTKDEVLADLTDVFGADLKINFWVNSGFTQKFENIDLYFSSHSFLAEFLKREKISKGYYFDVENWESLSVTTEAKWQSPWGTIPFEHPQNEEFFMSPYCELIASPIGQLVISPSPAQFEPGPIIAGRSVKTLILDAFSDDLKSNALISKLFPQVTSEAVQQKVNTQFQILQKAQSLDSVRLTKEEIKEWIRFSVTAWILKTISDSPVRIIGDFGNFFFQDLKQYPNITYSDFNWTAEIMLAAKKGLT